jgi:adenylate cyclase
MGTTLNILVGCDEGKSYELEDYKTYTVGRSPKNDIVINDRNVSRHHLKIVNNNSMFFIKDLNTKNGTFIDGKNVQPGEEVETREGVPIVIGLTVLGIGAISESSLKPFLNTVGIFKEIGESGKEKNPHGAEVIKKYLEFIYDMEKALGEATDINEISNTILDKTFNLLKRIDRCMILLTEDETGVISNIVYRSRDRIPINDPAQAYNQDLFQRSLKSNEPIMILDSSEEADEDMEEGDIDITQSLQIMRIRSAMCIPIKGFLGTRGALYVDSVENTKGFRKNDFALLKDACSRAALAMDNIDINLATLDNSIN